MTATLDRRLAGLLATLLLTIGVAAAPARDGGRGDTAQTHASRA
jgi:hypothetical protein